MTFYSTQKIRSTQATQLKQCIRFFLIILAVVRLKHFFLCTIQPEITGKKAQTIFLSSSKTVVAEKSCASSRGDCGIQPSPVVIINKLQRLFAYTHDFLFNAKKTRSTGPIQLKQYVRFFLIILVIVRLKHFFLLCTIQSEITEKNNIIFLSSSKTVAGEKKIWSFQKEMENFCC